MGREILRRVQIDGGEDYIDYDGYEPEDEEAESAMEEMRLICDSYNW